MITWGQIGLQDANSPVTEEFIYFHDFTIVILVAILRFVGVAIGGALVNKSTNLTLLEGQTVECVWTLVPALILIQIAAPSLVLLYMLDEAAGRSLTLKAVGHQWYWRYEYSDFWLGQKVIEFDSYIEKRENGPRLLIVDNALALPVGAPARVLVGSSDVLHSWTIPRLGVKADACPGRLNQVKFISLRPGVFFGQCSEICGANHRFIPISLEVGDSKDFLAWVENSLD